MPLNFEGSETYFPSVVSVKLYILPSSSEIVTIQPFTGLGRALIPRERDRDSFIVFVSGWSVIKPSTTSIFLSSFTLGMKGVIQLPIKNKDSISIIICTFLIINNFDT